MTRKYAVLLSLVVLVFMVATANAQYARIADIVSTDHNMSSTGPNTAAGMKAVSNTQVCYYCHSPHPEQNTTDTAVITAPNGQPPLWNHYLSSVASYGVYSSPTFSAFATDIADVGGATAGSATVTNLCLSCHDGTVGVNTLYKGAYDSASHTNATPDFGGGINVAEVVPASAVINNLAHVHPVNFTYNATLAAKSASLVVPGPHGTLGGSTDGVSTSSGKFLPLFAGKMQCASCHEVHSNSAGRPFLRASTTGSELCLGCHGK